MAYSNNKEIMYTIVDDFDKVIDEAGDKTINLRKIKWGNSDKVRLDLRTWYHTDSGEVVGKGTAFITEEGPSELIKVLLEEGYGRTEEVLNGIKDRDDFKYYLNKIVGKDSEFYDENAKDIKEDFYDASNILEMAE